MIIQWVGNKATMASEKHFNGQFNEQQMSAIVKIVLKNATHKGMSDRSNAGHPPSTIIWGAINGTSYAVVMDSNDIKQGRITVISFYDINEKTKEHKAKRFGMKGIKR